MPHFQNTALRLPAASLLATSLLLSACGDPAPGEGVEQRPMHEPMPEIVSLDQALQTPVIPTVDLGTMHAAEIEKILGAGPLCFFAYTAGSPPVLAVQNAENGTGRGVIKVHGKLVELQQDAAPDYHGMGEPIALEAGGAQVKVTLAPETDIDGLDPGREYAADAVFTLDQGLKVGYRGWYRCRGSSS